MSNKNDFNIDYSQYKSVNMDTLRAKSKMAAKKGYNPVEIESKEIAKTWWGKQWNLNLERYADFYTRIDRGKRYVRSGAVIDLQIEEGLIKAKVQGSDWKPYKVKIKIKPLSKENKEKIFKIANNQIESLESLVLGEFPHELSQLFSAENFGLFPTSDEIDIKCSCPDWAYLCKHAAAVLYGVGARLDDDPLMFFLLRSIDFNSMLQKSIEEKKNLMLTNLGTKTYRTIDNDKAKILFGF
ncbi:MAG: SWIM zinc finger family protein [Spirochaetaceae bacterium]|nr:SWIM zinc finger family protein [Spirochaetaceae bacterium]